MILVTVGTHYQQFDRLVDAADDLAAQINEKVIIQRGGSTNEPRFAEHFQWTSSQRMEELTREARIVITQASAGAILLALRYGKPLVVVPRLRRFGENFDDHQQQLAKALAAQGKVAYVDDPSSESLLTAIRRVEKQGAVHNAPVELVGALRQQLRQWESAQ
jgi:UDP-N-acetylglucosamine transferase subunit ALG13